MFIDANVFIKAYDTRDRNGQASFRLLEKISKGEQHAITSTLVFDEVAYAFLEGRGRDFALRVWRMMAMLPNLKIVPVDEKVLARVPPFIEAGLDPRDAFHAGAMKVNGISVICTYDHHFDKLPGIRREEPK